MAPNRTPEACSRHWPTDANLQLDQRASRWLREPLIYFFLAGALLFGIDRAIGALGGDGEIRIPATVQADTAARLRAALGRAPAEDELRRALQAWIRDEAVYREGLRRGLDKSDRVIRDRVVHKTLAVLHFEQSPPDIDDAALERWFTANAQRYARPAVFDLEVITLSAPIVDDTLQGLVARLNQTATEFPEPQSYGHLHLYRDAPQTLLLETYGAKFVTSVLEAIPDRWLHISNDKAMMLVRVRRMQPGSTPHLQDIRSLVRDDWLREEKQHRLDRRIDRLVQRYRIMPMNGDAR